MTINPGVSAQRNNDITGDILKSVMYCLKTHTRIALNVDSDGDNGKGVVEVVVIVVLY